MKFDKRTLPGLLLLLTAVFATRPSLDEQTTRLDPRPFRHADHVQASWFAKDERARDCRGCHVYSKDPKVARDPQKVCMSCHGRPGTTFSVEAEKGFETGLAPLRADDSPFFDHVDHGRLACKECHGPEDFETRGVSALDPMPVRRSAAHCGQCHGQSDPRFFTGVTGEQIRLEGKDPLIAALNLSEQMRPSHLGPFLHADHLADVSAPVTLEQLRKNEANRCSLCHKETLVAAATATGKKIALQACETCHRDATRALVFEVSSQKRTSRAALTFAHGAHLLEAFVKKAATEQGCAQIAKNGCATCHRHASVGHGAEKWTTTLPNKNGEPFAYSGCVTCHDRGSWHTTDHGEWNSCKGCHEFGTKRADFRDTRPKIEKPVRRLVGSTFELPARMHPHVDIKDGTILRFSGTGWAEDKAASQLADGALHALWMSEDGTLGFAVGVGGIVLRYESGTWSRDEAAIALAKKRPLDHVTMNGSTVWVGAGGKTLLRRDAKTWKAVDPASANRTGKVSQPRLPQQGALVLKLGIVAHAWVRRDRSEAWALRNGAKDCKTCHLGPIDKLAKRSRQAQFTHALHLPVRPTATDCAECHKAVETATSGESLGWRVAGSQPDRPTYRSYDRAACAGCHGELVERPKTVDRRVTLFSHEHHVKKGAKCTECHKFSGRDQARMSTSACTECHDHGENSQRVSATARRNRAEVTSCFHCHTENSAQIPPVGSGLWFEDHKIAGIQGTQHHPTDRACQECHVPSRTRSTDDDHVFAAGGFFRFRISDRHPAGEPRPADCLGCHWNRAPTGARLDPEDAETRKRLGDDLRRYPGDPSRRR